MPWPHSGYGRRWKQAARHLAAPHGDAAGAVRLDECADRRRRVGAIEGGDGHHAPSNTGPDGGVRGFIHAAAPWTRRRSRCT